MSFRQFHASTAPATAPPEPSNPIHEHSTSNNTQRRAEEEDVTDTNEVPRSAIYSEVVSVCEPFCAEGPWGRFRDSGAYCCPANPDELLNSLCRTYRVEDLVGSGVAVADGNQILLSPALLDAESPLIALRKQDDQPPCEILTREGCLSGRLPAVAALQDVIALREARENEPQLNVVFSFEQVMAYRSVGLPAALAIGLADVSRNALRELFLRLYPNDAFDEEEDAFDKAAWDHEDDRAADADDEVPEELSDTSVDDWIVTLHAWSMLDVEDRFEAETELIRSHFAMIEKYLNRSLRDARVVFTSAEAREALEFTLEHGTRADVRRALLAMGERGEPLIPRPVGAKKVFNVPDSMSGATSEFFEARRLQSDAGVQKRTWDNYDEALERDVLAPLREEAEAEPDPDVRSLKLAFAAQASLLHRQQAFTAGKIGVPSAGYFGNSPQGISIEDVEVTAKLAQGLVLLWKEIRRSPPRRPVIAATARTLRETTGNQASTDPDP